MHKDSFKYEDRNQTSLSNFIWDLKRKNKKFEVNWEILDRGNHSPPSPTSVHCVIKKSSIFYSDQNLQASIQETKFFLHAGTKSQNF